jgi:DNA processing protein
MASDAWLTLLAAAGAPAARVWRQALKSSGTADALVGSSQSALRALGLDDDSIAKLKSPDGALLERARAWLSTGRRRLVTDGGEHYPPLLAQLADAPLALWVEGENLALLSGPQLAVVGSRSPTRGGRDNAEQFARYLAARGLTITSGLATGIDGAGHRGALAEIGGTIAVLGGGLDSIYPREHTDLAAAIAERGLLVSEYAPGIEPHKAHFPQRNRIIAGLSLGTLVVEATRRSGSLITARLAADFGREVFAIPGSIHNPLARGCHFLIRGGAKLVEEAADVLVELAPQLEVDLATIERERRPEETASSSAAVDAPEYRNLLNLLGFDPRSISDLAEVSGLTAAELSSMLLVLELEGFVEALPGGRYSRLRKRD